MLYFFHMLSLSKPHIVISTERPRVEKSLAPYLITLHAILPTKA